MHGDHNIKKPSDNPKLKVELFDDKDNKKLTFNEDDRTIIKVKEIKASDLPQAELQKY